MCSSPWRKICISVVGLELAFAAAPPSMKSFVTACWLLTVFFGDILNAWITPWYRSVEKTTEAASRLTLSPGVYFGLLALLMVPVTIAFILVARRFNRTAAHRHRPKSRRKPTHFQTSPAVSKRLPDTQAVRACPRDDRP